jgi:hypothetical protein
MTLWYLLGAVVVLGIAILSVIGIGNANAVPVVWAGRIVPAIAALVACIAFCMASWRARLGLLAPTFFCVSMAALIAVMLLPHFMPIRGSNLYTMLLTIYPVLTLFPALALWHLATAMKRKTR